MGKFNQLFSFRFVEPEELIRALTELENSASSDAVVREQIANLPPEVSEVAMLSKLEDKEQAAKLAAQVSTDKQKFFFSCLVNENFETFSSRSMKPPKSSTNTITVCAQKWKIVRN